MSSGMLWTEKEVSRLRILYESLGSFEEVAKAFPSRTANAIRQKASRLGLKRPLVTSPFCESQTVLQCSNGGGDSEEYLFKCGSCGKWILVDLEEAEDKTIVCPDCTTVCVFVM
jgi:DNA-directed RNA polymerase subunit RPC12/RpoP